MKDPNMKSVAALLLLAVLAIANKRKSIMLFS